LKFNFQQELMQKGIYLNIIAALFLQTSALTLQFAILTLKMEFLLLI